MVAADLTSGQKAPAVGCAFIALKWIDYKKHPEHFEASAK